MEPKPFIFTIYDYITQEWIEIIIARILREYFYLRNRIPIFIYLFYLHLKESDNPIIDKIVNVCVSFIALVLSYSVTGFILGIPFSNIIPFDWHYAGLLNWGLFFFIYYRMSLSVTHHMLTSFTLSVLATVGGGWLYEISFWYPISMFINHYSIFYLNGQLTCLLLLTGELIGMNLKLNKYICVMFGFFMVFSMIMFADRFIFIRLFGDFYIYIYRIPVSLFLISLLSGVENKV